MQRRKFVGTLASAALGAVGLAGLAACATSPDNGPKATSGLSLAEIVSRGLYKKEGGGFQNPFPNRQPPGNFWRLLRWKLFSPNRFKHLYDQDRVRPVEVDWAGLAADPRTSLTFVKHACLAIRHQGRLVLVDPVFKDMFPFFTDFAPLAFDPAKMPAPDEVLITHGHYDHLSEETLALFPKQTHLISPLGYDYVFGDLGMKNRVQLDWLQTWRGPGLSVSLLPANHWTMRNPLMGPNRSLWGSFLLKLADGPTIFISGDVAWFDHYRELARLGPMDLAVFNLGAYEPRWFMKHSHMNPKEVARAFRELEAKQLMVVHWGAYRLGDEPVHLPPLDMKREMSRLGLEDRLLHLDPGQTWFF